MPIELYPLSSAELHTLADDGIPGHLAARIADGALPPPFVAARALRMLADGKPAHWCSTFLLVRRTDGAVVGGCGFKDAPRQGRVEIGYAVAPGCRRQGIATAAVRELVRYAFASEAVSEVLAQINPANVASARVAHKLAFDACGTAIDEDDEPLVQWLLHKTTIGDASR